MSYLIPGKSAQDCKAQYNLLLKLEQSDKTVLKMAKMDSAIAQEIPEEYVSPRLGKSKVVETIEEKTESIKRYKIQGNKGNVGSEKEDIRLLNTDSRISTQMTKFLSSSSTKEIF